MATADPPECVLGLDVGTSSVKALLVDATGGPHGQARAAYPTQRPAPGLSEQAPADWLIAAAAAVRQCLAATPARVTAIAVSGHMSAPVLLDGSGAVLAPCRTLTDSRAVSVLPDELRADIEARTGNRCAGYFGLPKLLWWARHDPALLTRTRAVLAPKDYVAAWLTGVAGSDPTDAGNTLLLDPVGRAWMPEVARAAGLDPAVLPFLREPGSPLGNLRAEAAVALGLPAGVPVATGASDMAASLLGTGMTSDEIVVTIGTSANVIAHWAAIDPTLLGRLTLHPGAAPQSLFALGSHLGGGGCLDWLASILGGEARLREAVVAAEAATADGLLFLPYLVGAGSPDFDPAARGAFLGLAASHGPAQLARAVLEGITADLCLSLDLLDEGRTRRGLVLSGGGAHLRLWPRLLADMAGRPVATARSHDASALGAALLAGVSIGWFGGTVPSASLVAGGRQPAAVPDLSAATLERRDALRARFAAARRLSAGV